MTEERTTSLAERKKMELSTLLEGLPEPKDMAKENTVRISLGRVKINHSGAQSFKFPLDKHPVTEKRGIIVYNTTPRAYWNKDNESDTVPLCQSRDGITPSPIDGRLPIGRSCLKCKMAEFGSQINQDGSKGRAPACKSFRLLLFLPENEKNPVLLYLPPTSVNSYDKLISSLYNAGLHSSRVVVNMKAKNNKVGSNSFTTVEWETVDRIEDFYKDEHDLDRAIETVRLVIEARKRYEEDIKRMDVDVDGDENENENEETDRERKEHHEVIDENDPTTGGVEDPY